MKNLLRISLVVLALATTGLFAKTAPATTVGSPDQAKIVKAGKKGHGHKQHAKHKKKRHRKRGKKS